MPERYISAMIYLCFTFTLVVVILRCENISCVDCEYMLYSEIVLNAETIVTFSAVVSHTVHIRPSSVCVITIFLRCLICCSCICKVWLLSK